MNKYELILISEDNISDGEMETHLENMLAIHNTLSPVKFYLKEVTNLEDIQTDDSREKGVA